MYSTLILQLNSVTSHRRWIYDFLSLVMTESYFYLHPAPQLLSNLSTVGCPKPSVLTDLNPPRFSQYRVAAVLYYLLFLNLLVKTCTRGIHGITYTPQHSSIAAINYPLIFKIFYLDDIITLFLRGGGRSIHQLTLKEQSGLITILFSFQFSGNIVVSLPQIFLQLSLKSLNRVQNVSKYFANRSWGLIMKKSAFPRKSFPNPVDFRVVKIFCCSFYVRWKRIYRCPKSTT